MPARPKRVDEPLFTPPRNTLPAINPDEAFPLSDVGHNDIEPARDFIMPRITIAQPITPQAQEHKAEYIPGIKVGDFIDMSSSEIFKGHLDFVVSYVAKRYLEWPKQRGVRQIIKDWGNVLPVHPSITRDEKGRMVTAQGVISETLVFYVLNVTAGGRKSFIPLASTALKAGKSLMTLMEYDFRLDSNGNRVRVPNYYRLWRATSVPMSNDQGDWFGWQFVAGKPILEHDPTGVLLEEAKVFFESCRDGLVQVDTSRLEEHESTGPSAERLSRAAM
jgi:hypothetical protein